jgi:hypothetical protein
VGLSLLEIGYEATGACLAGRNSEGLGRGGVLRLLAGIRQPIASRENRAPLANRISSLIKPYHVHLCLFRGPCLSATQHFVNHQPAFRTSITPKTDPKHLLCRITKLSLPVNLFCDCITAPHSPCAQPHPTPTALHRYTQDHPLISHLHHLSIFTRPSQ